MKRHVVVGVACALGVLFASDARACSCVQVSPEQAMGEHDAVFEGRVIRVEGDPGDPAGRLRATMEVVQQWKGIEQEEVVVETAAQSSMCGVEFEPDTSWLVYADREGDRLTTGLCSRTRRMEDAEEDRAALGAGAVPVEIGEEDEVEPAPQRQAPAQGGCASCAVGAKPGRRGRVPPGLAGVVAALAAWASRRRRRSA